MTTLTLDPPTLDGHLRDRFIALRDFLNSRLYEREAIVQGMLDALVAKQHCFQLGRPGVGKTFAVELLFDAIEGAKSTKVLISRFTTDRHVFGPESIQALKEGRSERVLTGLLADVHLALLDELWNGRSVINTMHTALNQRRFEQGGKSIPIPLSSAFVTSNKLPESEDYDAIYDRIPLRFLVEKIRSPQARQQLLRSKAFGNPPVTPVVSWAEVEMAQAQVREVDVPNGVIGLMDQVANRLAEMNVTISDRRLAMAVPLVQAEAWFAGRREATLADVQVLADVAWSDPEEVTNVRATVLTMCNPLWARTAEFADSLGHLARDVEAAVNEPSLARRNALAHQLNDKLVKASQTLRELKGEMQATGLGPQDRVAITLEDCRRTLVHYSQQLLETTASTGTASTGTAGR